MYVGNLSFDTTESEVRALFEEHGTVQSVNLIMDRETGRPRGFGFVEMNDDEANAAMAKLNGQEFGGRALNINEARAREGGGGGGRGGFGGGGGRGGFGGGRGGGGRGGW
ncbi:MAG: RNA recognition motif domain-containing protein [Phycisphaerales bacterium]